MLYRYRNEVLTLQALFDFGRNLRSSVSVADDNTWFQRAALIVLDQALTSAGVALSYLPESAITSPFKVLSPSLLASQGRMMMDSYLTLAYLLDEKTGPESELQELVWNQAIDYKRWEMVQQANPNNPELPNLVTPASVSRQRTTRSLYGDGG